MSNAANQNGSGLESDKSKDIRQTNITAARAISDVVRTSLGPRGMDKMVSKFQNKLTNGLNYLDSRSKG